MQRKLGLICLSLLVLIVSACQATPVATPTPETALEVAGLVSVTGKLLPKDWTTVGAQTGGMVTEVLVEVGDSVAEGEVLLRVDDADARLAVLQAEAALEVARARVVQLKAGARDTDVAVIDAQAVAARAVISQTIAQRDQLWDGSREAEIAAVEAELAAARTQQLIARQDHDDMMKCYKVPQPDGSEKKVCPTLGTYEERARFHLAAADQAVAAAEARLAALQKGGPAQQRIANAGITVAKAEHQVALAQLAQIKAGVAPEEIAVAEALLREAEAALKTAQVELTRTAVRAPLSGTVGAVAVRRGEFVTPGQALVTLGDLSTLRVETTDLDEIDVAQVALEQEVAVTFDALPNRVYRGHITRIAPMADASSGGVNYTVIIELLEPLDPVIRWGMTAFVDIQSQP